VLFILGTTVGKNEGIIYRHIFIQFAGFKFSNGVTFLLPVESCSFFLIKEGIMIVFEGG
jgi:hypothetical protein